MLLEVDLFFFALLFPGPAYSSLAHTAVPGPSRYLWRLQSGRGYIHDPFRVYLTTNIGKINGSVYLQIYYL